jgi:hypothetical protein
MKRIILVLFQFLLGIMLWGAQNSEIKSNTETEPTSTQIMDNFISETNFIGTYTLSKDERIFSELKGRFPLPEVTGQKTFIANCDSITKIIRKLYGSKAEAYSFSHSEIFDKEGSIDENKEFSTGFSQTYNGLQINIMSNWDSQHFSEYKEFLESDSSGVFSQFISQKRRNSEYKPWREPYRYEYLGRIDIKYKPKEGIYIIYNRMFLKPVTLPELNITKDDALAIAKKKYKGSVYVGDLRFYAIPKDESRTDFDYKLVWIAGSSDSKYGGVTYNIDGTTGKMLFESRWIE